MIDHGYPGNNSATWLVFRSKVIPLIPELKTDQDGDHHGDADNLPNILLLGIDSISRLNYERHFTKTKRLIEANGFHTLYGYNKVADNTFPNLTPLLTGHYAEDIWKNVNQPFDYFPFIWKVSYTSM